MRPRAETEPAWLPFASAAGALELDLGQAAQPDLVAEVLACCGVAASGRPLSPEEVWQLEVGQRTLYLLKIAAEASGEAEIDVVMTCTNPDCASRMEVGLSIDELAELQAAAHAESHLALEIAGQALVLRRTTGSDQRSWRSAGGAARVGLAGALRDLVVSGSPEVDEIGLALADEALQEFDPLVDFSLQVCCPGCGQTHPYELDLEGMALTRLRRAQWELLQEVHCLAGRYGWSEAQILALPAWRRRRYLQLIDRERSA